MSQPTVLLVDDEPYVTEALRRALHDLPYRLLSAHSGAEALEVLSRESVDVVVADEKMPGMAGSEMLSTIRRRHPDTIRIILTGHATLDAAVRSINEGEIHRFFLKPCNERELTDAIREALTQKALMAGAKSVLRVLESGAADV